MKSRLLGVVSACICSLGVHPAANALTYEFTTVASTNGTFSFVNPEPALNNSGVVTFQSDGVNGPEIVAWSTGQYSPIADMNPSTSADDFAFFSSPSVNNNGTVAFDGSPSSGVFGVYVGNGGPTATILDNSGAFSFVGDTRTSINDDGTVAYGATTNGIQGIYTSDGGTPTKIADTDDGFSQGLINPVINNSSTVAFGGLQNSGEWGVFIGNGGSLVTIDTTLDQIGSHDINNAGKVSYIKNERGQPGSGNFSVLTWDAGIINSVADDSGPFKFFGPTSINDADSLAFIAGLDAGGAGIFTGADPSMDKVIATGDEINGLILASIGMGTYALNDLGQVVFWGEMTDGTEGVYLANPVPIPQAVYLFASGLIGLIWVAKTVRRKI